jgi:hypothetical protein
VRHRRDAAPDIVEMMLGVVEGVLEESADVAACLADRESPSPR